MLRPATSLCALLVAIVSLTGQLLADPPQQSLEAAFGTTVQPLFARYCTECHSGSEPKGDLDLTQFRDAAAARANRQTWEELSRKLRAGEMPPEDKPQPTADEMAAILGWADAMLADGAAPNPGRVTIRRLNRVEYNNTIRDLVGVDFHPADDFPSDDVGYGFDNIGDVLSLPPLLLEKYLAAAETIVDKAIVAKPPSDVLASLEGRKLEQAGRGDITHDTARSLITNGELRTQVNFPASGEYTFRIRAYADQAGDELAKMALLVEGREIAKFDVEAVEDDPQVFEARTTVEAGDRRVAVAFLNDFWDPKVKERRKRDRNLYVESLDVISPPANVELPESHRRIFTRQPTGDDKAAVARELIGNFATRAFRRPVEADEVERLAKFVDMAEREGDSFETGIKLAVQAILVSPQFLFRIELDPDPDNQSAVRTLNDFELATRLSYFLWASMPDDELFAEAKRGSLHEPDRLHGQVRRMLADAKAQALVENFAGQWLQLRNLKTISPDPKLFPSFDEPLRDAMRRETELFFATVMREDRNILDFLDADFTFLNERLARHYGIDGVQGDEFRRVPLTGDRRGGVLAQASVLAVTSNPTRTSPVKRGKWVLENLLGAPPPAPPPGVPVLKDDETAALTGSLRERMEQHREKAECAVCHNRMDPIGFGLENYDAIGAWRTNDGKFAIDPAGTLPGGKSFAGPRDLKGILKKRHVEFTRCLAEKMLTYALGRGLEYYDRRAVDQIVAATARGEHKFSALVLAVVDSEPFQKRKAKGGDP